MSKYKNLFNASISGDLHSLEKNIANGVDVNTPNSDGFTPLHLAIRYGKTEVMEILIDAGANVDYRTDNSYTPFEYACMCNQIQAARLLVQRGCAYKSKSSAACHYASAMNHYEIVVFLLDIGVDINQHDNVNRTPAHWAAQEGNDKIFKLLVDNGADLTVLDEDKSTALYIASGENHIEIVRMIIDKNTNVDIEADTTPFMIACAFRNYEIAEMLLQAGADIDHADDEGRTALFYAKVKNNRKLIRFLKSHNARTDITDKYGIFIADIEDENIRIKLYNELFA